MGCKKLSILAQETNHLGNVLSVVSDRRYRITSSGVIAYEPIILSATDYYPFGMEMPGRSISSNSYRFGFNDERSVLSERKKMSGGHLAERTAKRLERTIIGEWGSQTHYDYGFRIYNPAIGKFLSVDPLMKKFPDLTPYQFASNSPISGIDLDGLEFSLSTNSDGHVYVNAHFKVLNSSNLSNENVKLLMGSLKAKYIDIMDRKYANRQFKGWITFEYVDEVQSLDYFIEIVEPSDKKLEVQIDNTNKQVVGLVNEIGGQNFSISTVGLTNSDFSGGLATTITMDNAGSSFSDAALHEIGHLFGLLHIWDDKYGEFSQSLSISNAFKSANQDPMSLDAQKLSDNLMNSPGNPNLMLGLNFSQKKLTQDQFGQMYRDLYNKKIGQKKNENDEN